MNKIWNKKGLLIAPNKNSFWIESYVGPSFIHFTEGNKFTIYLTGRDRNNKSRIGKAFGEFLDGKLIIKEIESIPIFNLGEVGCFDESGVSYPWLVFEKNRVLMYYVGWVSGGLGRFQNYTGLAQSVDGGNTFERLSRVPVLDRSDDEPFGTGSCAVIKTKIGYEMLYTSFNSWLDSTKGDREFMPSYDLKHAISKDGINWERNNLIALQLANDESVICKASIVNQDAIFKVWYSYRGSAYRIGYAEGSSLMKLVRKDENVNIRVSESGWDSEMIEYSHVVICNGYEIMIYNGNNFGQTGLGYATRKI
jgi:hypothetical protein